MFLSQVGKNTFSGLLFYRVFDKTDVVGTSQVQR